MRTKCVWLKYVYITIQQRRKTYQNDISRQFEICTEICNVNTIKTSQDKKTDIRKKKKKKSKNTSEEAMSLLVEKRIRQMAITTLKTPSESFDSFEP